MVQDALCLPWVNVAAWSALLVGGAGYADETAMTVLSSSFGDPMPSCVSKTVTTFPGNLPVCCIS